MRGEIAPRTAPNTDTTLDSRAQLRRARRRHVVVIGGKRVARRVQEALEGEEIEVVPHTHTEVALSIVTDTTVAVIVIPPIAGHALVATCEQFAGREPRVPVFVTCGPTSEKTIKQLYLAGVSAVFFWPTDRDALVRTMFRISRPLRPAKKKRSPQEIALQELVTSHLRTEKDVLGKRLRVRVTNRYVLLAGHVDALWKVVMAENIAGEVPGVEEVFSDAVLVSGQEQLSDKAIATAAREVLEHTNGIDASTLAITVSQGVVSLAGTATTRNELQRVVGLISHVRGVQRIEDWAAITTKGKRQDQQVAKAVREAVALRYPRAGIEVAVFGGIAVLSGNVKKFVERREVVALALRQRGVWKVVDKIRIAKKRSRS